MPIFALDDALRFPPVHLAEGSGLLAMGGDLSPERLILAYKSGIFPWYDHPPILWWCPDPRFVLFPVDFKVSKNLKPLLKNNTFEFTINIAFSQVIDHCKEIFRPGQDGTWITEEVKAGYVKLHELGFAHSAEVWQQGELVGGLYGIKIGKVFFGESMFSLVSNASRYAFAKYMDVLKSEDIRVIDCQIHSDYLESMGAEMIDGKEFDRLLERYCRG
ncbi:MAG: leucyl/phenylalanyl-tRNA--protein transferase [Sphingobacteriales bacterium]|nr:leucyl/phenylalanyl-tRNA--protein transferase [Sphingobacteriales bacterium]